MAEAPTETAPRQLLFVTGMPGRGAATLGRIMAALGGRLPRPPDLGNSLEEAVGAAAWARELHDDLARRYGLVRPEARPDALLVGANATYDSAAHRQLDQWLADRFAGSTEIVVDDPWFPWLAPLWQVAAARAGARTSVAVVVDRPTAYVAQQRTADDPYPDVALTAEWVNTLLSLERATRGERRSVVSYDALATDWPLAVKTLGDRLDLDFVHDADPGQVIRASEAAPAASPEPYDASWADLAVSADIRDLAEETHAALTRLAGRDEAAVHAELDALRDRFAARYELAAATATSSIEDAVKKGRRGAAR